MDASSLEEYEYQLSQVELALAKDPTNAELLSLKTEMNSLIELTKDYLATSGSVAEKPAQNTSKAATAAKQEANASLKSGDDCMARYSGDGKYYPAKITNIGGSATARVYSVIFNGYNSTELVNVGDIKPMSEGKKRALKTEEEVEKDRKKRKAERKAEVKVVKNAEQVAKQKSWQSFAKKSSKKGTRLPGMDGTSMFKSPEDGNPNARVGVVGSGRGMTDAVKVKRQTFQSS